MNECFKRNVKCLQQGYRYNEETKLFAAYTRMIGGRKNYSTFKSNAFYSVPSLQSVDNFIRSKTKRTIREGVVRSDELFNYLRDMNLPFMMNLIFMIGGYHH